MTEVTCGIYDSCYTNVQTCGHGWSFEGPDPEVGLFGDTVVHEDCPLWTIYPDGPPVTESTMILDHPEIEGLLNITVTYTCRCAAQTACTSQEPA